MFRLISGVSISPLVDIYGFRVVMSFGFLYATAIALSAVAPTVGSLYFIFRMLTGKHLRQPERVKCLLQKKTYSFYLFIYIVYACEKNERGKNT